MNPLTKFTGSILVFCFVLKLNMLREHTTIATAMIASAQSWSELSTTIVPIYVKNLDFLLDYNSIFWCVRVLWNVYYIF